MNPTAQTFTSPPRTLPKFLWHYVALQKFPLITALCMVMLLGVYPSANNYIMKVLVDHVASAEVAPPSSWLGYFGGPVLLFLICFEVTNILWRIYDYAMLKSMPIIRKQVVGACTQALAILLPSNPQTALADNVVMFPGKKDNIAAPQDAMLQFADVAYQQDDGAQIFKHLRCTLKAGDKCALVGPSGSGKSTLLKLVAGLLQPAAGHIYIQGQDIATLKEASLRELIAFVPQNPILMHLSVMDNIRYAVPNKGEADIVAMAERLGIHEMIMQLPAGYDSMVGEQGTKLSGGQRQLIAILRAAVQESPIMLLDEPTSSLDSKTEKRVLTSLFATFQDATLILVSHRPEVLKHVARVLVLKDGKLKESNADAINKNLF